MAPDEASGNDVVPHRGVVWEKILEMNLPERDLIDSFDTPEDFTNYLGRKPKMDWETTKSQLAGGRKVKTTDDLREKAKAMEGPKEKKPTLKDIHERLKKLEAEEAADDAEE